MRRVDSLCSGIFQNFRSPAKAATQVPAVKIGKRIARNRMTFAIDSHAACSTVAQQHANRRSVFELGHAFAKILRLAPGHHSHRDHRLQRGRFILHAVVAGEIAMLVRINGLHRAFPRTNFLVEDAIYVGHGMQMQVPPDVVIAKTGAEQQCRGMDRAARHDNGFAFHDDAVATFRACFDAGCRSAINAHTFGSRFHHKFGAVRLCICQPGLHAGLFRADRATVTAIAAHTILIAANDVARHDIDMPTQAREPEP